MAKDFEIATRAQAFQILGGGLTGLALIESGPDSKRIQVLVAEAVRFLTSTEDDRGKDDPWREGVEFKIESLRKEHKTLVLALAKLRGQLNVQGE